MKRNKFSLSNYKLLTCDMGKLVPVGWSPVLPGDTIQQKTSALIRVSPMIAPVMHPVTVRFHSWYVPYRILWDGWEDFITGGPDGLNDTVPPVRSLAGQQPGDLPDYLGVDPTYQNSVNAFPINAYNKIFNEWYRDQDLVTEVAENNVQLQNIAWERDYFTTARPWTQKGDAVTLPVGGQAPVTGSVVSNNLAPRFLPQGNPAQEGNLFWRLDSALTINNPAQTVEAERIFGSESGLQAGPDMVADLGSADQITINDFRMGFALQRYKEARARYGSRYSEYLAYLGVKSSDARLQRPEYLGGGKQTISFSEVLNTTSAIDDPDSSLDDLGRMGGHGIAAMRTNRYRKFFEEHGIVMTLMSVRPKTMYANALHREWLKSTKEDFWQRELQHVGQQEIWNAEVYGPHASPKGTFGFNNRYDEYRHQPSTVAGEFRTTLNHWHMARDFATDPVLNQSFIECDATKRIHAEQTGHPLLCMVNHNIQARRLVSRAAQNKVM